MWSPLRFLLALLILPVVGGLLLFINILQMLSLFVQPLSGVAFRRFNRFVARTWFNFLAFTMERVLRVEFVVTGDPLPREENAFVIANHQTQADIPALVVIASRCGRAGDVKWFVKDPLKWVPGVGWGLKFLDCLFVKRNWSADQEKILATFERLRKNQVPFWILSFVEGTRLTPAKLERAQEYERKAGLPVLEHVLSPRTRGFEATLEGLGSLTHAVYDFTIAFEGYRTGRAPSLGSLFFGPLQRVHLHVHRVPSSALPNTREARAQWVLDRFTEKDKRLAEFHRRGSLV